MGGFGGFVAGAASGFLEGYSSGKRREAEQLRENNLLALKQQYRAEDRAADAASRESQIRLSDELARGRTAAQNKHTLSRYEIEKADKLEQRKQDKELATELRRKEMSRKQAMLTAKQGREDRKAEAKRIREEKAAKDKNTASGRQTIAKAAFKDDPDSMGMSEGERIAKAKGMASIMGIDLPAGFGEGSPDMMSLEEAEAKADDIISDQAGVFSSDATDFSAFGGNKELAKSALATLIQKGGEVRQGFFTGQKPQGGLRPKQPARPPAALAGGTPPVHLLKEGQASNFGPRGTWTLENGKPKRLK